MEEIIYEEKIIQKLSDDVDLNNLKLPFIVKDRILMSPGVWNSYYYSHDAINDAYLQTDWENKEIRSLFLDHEDKNAREWIGEVRNIRTRGEDVIGDLVVVDMGTAVKLAYGAKMGISPKVHGPAENNKMQRFQFDNFSVVINPAVKTAWINNSENFNLDELDDHVDVYREFLQIEEVTEKMSEFTDFVKKFIKAHPDMPVQDAFKKAGAEFKKRKEAKMEDESKEEEVIEEEVAEMEEELPEEESEDKAEDPEVSVENMSTVMFEILMDEIKELKDSFPSQPFDKPGERKISKKDIEKEQGLAEKKPKDDEEEKKKKEEEKKMAKKEDPKAEDDKKKKIEAEKKVKIEVEKKMSEEKVVNEMSQKMEELEAELNRVNQKLNEPNKKSVKQEMSAEDADADMMEFLKTVY